MKVILSLLCLSLIACVEVEDLKKEKSAISSDATISYKIEPLAQPQAYSVHFIGVDCQRMFTKKTAKSTESGQLSGCTDVVSSPGRHLYQFADFPAVPIDIPEDRILSGTTKVSDLGIQEPIKNSNEFLLTISGRLYFLKGSELITEGRSIMIEALSIHSEGAEISTFMNGQKALPGVPGRSGGTIRLKAKSLSGALRIHLTGEQGGDGESLFTSNKKIQDLQVNGSHGGNSGRVLIEVEDHNHAQIDIFVLPGQGGEGSEVRSICMSSNCESRILRSKGEIGKPGLREKSCYLKNGACLD